MKPSQVRIFCLAFNAKTYPQLLFLRIQRTEKHKRVLKIIETSPFPFFSAQSILPKELQFVLQDMKGPLAGAALSTPVAQPERSGYNYKGNPVYACGYRSMGLTVVLVG